jgi:hypothetical protein
MSIRLGQALGTSAELWAGMQLRFDLYQAAKGKRTKIKRLVARAKGGSVLDLKGMFEAPAGVKVSINDMRVNLPSIK